MLCRNESLPPPRSYPTRLLVGVLVAILVVSGAAIAHRAVTSFAPAAIAQGPVVTPSEPGGASPGQDVAPSQPVVPVTAPDVPALPEPQPEPAVAHLADAANAADLPATLTGAANLDRVEPTPAPLAQEPQLPPALPLPAPESRAAPSRPPPTEAELRAALSATPIVMYSASWCGVCRKAKQFLSANGLRYQEIDADATPGSWDKIEQLTGSRGVPLIIVDGEQTPPGLSPSNIMRAASRSVERRLGVQGIQIRAH